MYKRWRAKSRFLWVAIQIGTLVFCFCGTDVRTTKAGISAVSSQLLTAKAAAKNERPYLNVQGPEYLSKFEEPVAPARVRSGETTFLWDIVPVAEDPDFDPLQYLDQIKVEWHQVSGPTVTFENAQNRAAAVRLPKVKVPEKIELRCVLANAAGKRILKVFLLVLPPRGE